MSAVSPEECLTRYVTEKGYYRPNDGTVRHNAFMPSSNRELSVYRISNLSSQQVWNIGELYVAIPRCKPLLGRADIRASKVMSKGLRVIPATQPHPLHANITDWPNDRDTQRMIALELAAVAKLRLR